MEVRFSAIEISKRLFFLYCVLYQTSLKGWTSQMGLVKATLQVSTTFTSLASVCQSASSERRHKGHLTAVLDQFFVAPLDFMNKFFPTSGF